MQCSALQISGTPTDINVLLESEVTAGQEGMEELHIQITEQTA